MSLLQKDTKKVIAGLEILAGVLALYLLGKMHSLCGTFFFVDNEAAPSRVISMNSHRKTLKFPSKFAATNSTVTWIARVPSCSNPADEPSRMQTEHSTRRDFSSLDIPWNVVEDLMSEHV